LFALAAQLFLSFGHFHAQASSPATHSGASGIHAQFAAAPLPQTHNPAGLADDYCAICASMQMVATAASAAPPVLHFAAFSSLRLKQPDAAVVVSPPHSLFQSRAPPTV
jgi:hypothetical protein